MLLGGLLALAACSSTTKDVETFYDSKLTLDNPIDWWHQLQGGPIAAQRPPPPGITDPYPNLSQVPARPTPTDPAARSSLLAQLTAERDRTRLITAQDPIVFPGGAPATAKSPAGGTAAPSTAPTAVAPVAADASSMTLDAATTPPAPSAAPPPAAQVDPAPPRGLSATPTNAVPVTSGPIPAMPAAAPALPNLPGIPITVAQPISPRPRGSAVFSFPSGSAALPESADQALRALAARRAGGPIRVMAGGDARSASPEAQRDALPLALRRTGAITAALIAAGVPQGAIRVEATALGREADARLVD